MSTISRILTDLAAARRARNEVASMSKSDALDVGVSLSQLAHYVTLPSKAPRRMEEMAEIFGADVEALAEDRWDYADMISRCVHCNERRACNRALLWADVTKAEDCGFCPNAERFEGLAEVRPANVAQLA